MPEAPPSPMTDPVWAQITEADRAFLTSVAKGLLIARAKYPGPTDRYIALTGEAGEAFYAYQRLITGRGSVEDLGEELRQVAQMACRLATEGDAMLKPDIQAQFPCIVQPDPEIKPHQPGYRSKIQQTEGPGSPGW